MNEILEFLSNNWWIYLVAGLLSIPLLGLVRFSASSLSNEQISFLLSIVYGVLTFYLAFLAGWFLMGAIGKKDGDEFGANRGIALALTVGVGWLLGGGAALISTEGRIGQSLKITTLETVLRAFVLMLVAGLTAVIAACAQVARNSQGGGRILVNFTIVMVVIAGGAGGIYLLTWILKNRGTAR